ncbi:MAG: hypothetical protein M4579_003955 [Chaenotheca gracillima]|nr:MAG: hypothetical protein M4579_003955 [Chaenotheca gracillima]
MQGFNMGRYVPPEHEGTVSANKLAGKHALGARARKSGQGILTVRFEMPFAIWCTTCPKPTIIGQGVRFNAEKKKVGNYHSTPIFSFRMKHTACGGAIEVRTDPKNTAYVVTEGAKKRDTGEDKQHEGEIKIQTEEEREKLRNDAFAALEVKIDDRKAAATERTRLQDLRELRERDWSDPWMGSRKLRKTFRADRKVRETKQATTEALKDKMSLDIDLLEERDEDKQRAGFVEFGTTLDDNDMIDKARARPLFEATRSEAVKDDREERRARRRDRGGKPRRKEEDKTELLRKEIRGNTRAATDPFLVNALDWGPSLSEDRLLPGIKRRAPLSEQTRATDSEAPQISPEQTMDPPQSKLGLVDYESD